MKILKIAAIICSGFVLALPCLAVAGPVDTVNVVHDGYGAHDVAAVWGGGLSGIELYSGVYMLDKSAGVGVGQTWPNGPIPSFCIELHELSPHSTVTYQVTSPKNVYNSFLDAKIGDTKANYLREMWGRFYDDGWANGGPYCPQQNRDAEAFAAAVWEIVYEDLPSSPAGWDVASTSGSHGFRCTDIDTAKANYYLHSLTGCGPKADLRAFVYQGKQDYIVEVPEPATITLLGLSGVLSLVRRKRTAS